LLVQPRAISRERTADRLISARQSSRCSEMASCVSDGRPSAYQPSSSASTWRLSLPRAAIPGSRPVTHGRETSSNPTGTRAETAIGNIPETADLLRMPTDGIRPIAAPRMFPRSRSAALSPGADRSSGLHSSRVLRVLLLCYCFSQRGFARRPSISRSPSESANPRSVSRMFVSFRFPVGSLQRQSSRQLGDGKGSRTRDSRTKEGGRAPGGSRSASSSSTDSVVGREEGVPQVASDDFLIRHRDSIRIPAHPSPLQCHRRSGGDAPIGRVTSTRRWALGGW
jgi:hypothetical protein